MLWRIRPAGFIEPCLPSARSVPPPGGNWLHEIKHDGFRMLARRDGVRIRLGAASAAQDLASGRRWSEAPTDCSRCKIEPSK
jgi:hypothetical protein